MIELAIETSARVGSVAIARDRQLLDEASFPHGLQHAARLLPMIDQLFKRHALTPAMLSHIHVSVGPGSFTGLRVGVTMAKTLAFVTRAKITAVPSVDVIAQNAAHAPGRHLIVVLDAKRQQVYAATYASDGQSWQKRQPAQLTRLADIIAKTPQPLALIGEGVAHHLDAIPPQTPIEPDHQPLARNVLKLGQLLAIEQRWTDPMQLVPHYIRLPEAEEKRLAAMPDPAKRSPT